MLRSTACMHSYYYMNVVVTIALAWYNFNLILSHCCNVFLHCHTANSIRIDRIQIAFIVHTAHRQTNCYMLCACYRAVYKIRMSCFLLLFFSKKKQKITQEAWLSTETRNWKSPFGKVIQERNWKRKINFLLPNKIDGVKQGSYELTKIGAIGTSEDKSTKNESERGRESERLSFARFITRMMSQYSLIIIKLGAH